MNEQLRDEIVAAALAWERARQHATAPGLTVERHLEEMLERRRAHNERERELRALLRAALGAGADRGAGGG